MRAQNKEPKVKIFIFLANLIITDCLKFFTRSRLKIEFTRSPKVVRMRRCPILILRCGYLRLKAIIFLEGVPDVIYLVVY